MASLGLIALAFWSDEDKNGWVLPDVRELHSLSSQVGKWCQGHCLRHPQRALQSQSPDHKAQAERQVPTSQPISVSWVVRKCNLTLFCLGLTLHSTQIACHDVLTNLNPKEGLTAFQGMSVGDSMDLHLCEQEHWPQSNLVMGFLRPWHHVFL